MLDFIRDPSIYNLLRGPLVWIAFFVFIGGSIYKVRELIRLAKNEKVVMPYISLKLTLRSLLHWMIPFASVNWRNRWVITIVTFLFHIGLVFTPIFLVAHNVLMYESWGIDWWTLPEGLADIMTMIVIGSCVFFALRRLYIDGSLIKSNICYSCIIFRLLESPDGSIFRHRYILSIVSAHPDS